MEKRTQQLPREPSMYPALRDNIIRWLQQIYGTNVPIALQIEKLREEWMELEVTWRDDPDNDDEIINELTDIAIVAIGILGLYGADFVEEATKKTAITRVKYDPLFIADLQARGYTLAEALEICKTNWLNVAGNYEPPQTTRKHKISV